MLVTKKSLRELADALEVVAGADTMGMTCVVAVPGGGVAAGAPVSAKALVQQNSYSSPLLTVHHLLSGHDSMLRVKRCKGRDSSSCYVMKGHICIH